MGPAATIGEGGNTISATVTGAGGAATGGTFGCEWTDAVSERVVTGAGRTPVADVVTPVSRWLRGVATDTASVD